MAIAIQFKGDIRKLSREWASKLQAKVDAVENAMPRALEHGLEPIYDTSQVLVPKDTGRLMQSGLLETERTSKGVTGYVSYDTEYAMIQHENLEFMHTPPEQAKYLEEAFNRHGDDVEDRMAEFLRSFMTSLKKTR